MGMYILKLQPGKTTQDAHRVFGCGEQERICADVNGNPVLHTGKTSKEILGLHADLVKEITDFGPVSFRPDEYSA